jgi:hypothetical protein
LLARTRLRKHVGLRRPALAMICRGSAIVAISGHGRTFLGCRTVPLRNSAAEIADPTYGETLNKQQNAGIGRSSAGAAKPEVRAILRQVHLRTSGSKRH